MGKFSLVACGDFPAAMFRRFIALLKLWGVGGAYVGVPKFVCHVSLVILFLFAPALRAESSLEQARRAQALLGPDVWSRILKIENSGRASHYPRFLHALVFELADILWFYTAVDGTQSLSLHQGRLAEEKADLGPLLRDIEPGFTRWSIVRSKSLALEVPRGELSNGCFIESVAELRLRLARGESLERPQLLSYYDETPFGLHGHTVLVFGRDQHWEFFDPGRPQARQSVEKQYGSDPLVLARALEGPAVVKARCVALDFAAPISELMIASAEASGRDGKAKPDRT